MLCPRCDQQGKVELVVIKKTGERVHLCDECDALWKEDDEVTKSNFVGRVKGDGGSFLRFGPVCFQGNVIQLR